MHSVQGNTIIAVHELIKTGKIKAVIDRIYDFKDITSVKLTKKKAAF